MAAPWLCPEGKAKLVSEAPVATEGSIVYGRGTWKKFLIATFRLVENNKAIPSLKPFFVSTPQKMIPIIATYIPALKT